MDTKQFLAEFGHIANAPGGVDKLRELILSLAVTGRLVEQNSEDQPASEWLQACDQMKEKLYAEKKIPKPKQMLDIAPEEMPFAPPPGWSFARLGRFTSKIGSGSTPRGGSQTYVKKGIPFLRSQNVWNDGIRLDDVAYITPETNQNMGGTILQAHDLLLNITGASLGRCAVVPTNLVPANVSQHVTIIRLLDATARHYLHICFLSPLLQSMIWSRQVGMAREGLSKKVLEQFEIPLPPIKEQSRIVAKVDELMALCYKLETQQQERRKLQNALRQAILQALTNATCSQELQTTWARLADNFMRLFHAPEDVDDVIAALKSLAVRGLLVEASVTSADLEAIKADCSQLRVEYINDGLMRRQKLVSMAEYETIYPNHWVIAPFDEVAIVIGGVTKGRNLRGKQMMVCPYLAVANVQRGHFKLDGLKTIEIAADELAKYQVQKGDLLITEGGDWDKVGRTAIWRGGITNCLHQNHVFKARVPSKQLLNEWVELVFNSNIGRDYFAGASKQTTNLASINMTQLRSFALPIPPLDEQKRIITLLAELTSQCTEWRNQLQRKQSLSALLANAVISTLTGLTIEQEEEPMRAPQTELIAPLCLGTPPDIKAQAPLATILARHNGEMSAKDLWQRFGGEIDAFYAQLKIEVAHGWIREPAPAEVREKPDNTLRA
ncbi:restriction endonuclease subunit S [Aeromonas sp. 82P]|uniref:restriction endonuclease subunit S n=1 Tax=Aeromonas sp. 82P TaxID=3452726 RepID=UPI003F7A181C